MVITIENLTKKYGSKTALNGISLKLGAGIYGLLGPNGAGKSTLMNLLVGNLKPTEGKICIDGRDIEEMGRQHRCMIGYMPQSQNVYSYFTGFQFLCYIAALKGIEKKKVKSLVLSTAGKVNMSEHLYKKLGGYSGGMRQRILLAQAILGNPEIIILDEPTAGLDPKERIRVRNLIAEIAMEKTVLIATHVVQDVEYISKEIILLKEGELVDKNTPENLLMTMRDKVFEIITSPDKVGDIMKTYHTSNLVKEGEQAVVRIVSDAVPVDYEYRKVTPNLEDTYLYVFEEGV